MKCENCGKETDYLEADMFDCEGYDVWVEFPVQECENHAVIIDTNTNWTGYGMSEEAVESIRCPHCRKFPFKSKVIQEYAILQLVMFKEE